MALRQHIGRSYLAPCVIHTMRKRPVGADGKNPENRRHPVQEWILRAGMGRECANDQKHYPLRAAQESDIAFWNQALGTRTRITNHHRSHQGCARQKDVEGRVKLRITCVKDHQSDEGDHIRETVKRGVEKPTEARDTTCEASHFAIEHVEQIGDNEDDTRPEEVPKAEQ